MTAAFAQQRASHNRTELYFGLLLVAVTLPASIGVAYLGLYSLFVLAVLACGVLVILARHRVIPVVVVAMIFLEPGAIDRSGSFSALIYEFPEGVTLPFNTSPIEILVFLLLLFSVGELRNLRHIGLPNVAPMVPLVIAAGFAYGRIRGADIGIAYNEARGLLFGMAVFVLLASCPASTLRSVLQAAFWATGVLAAIVCWRYFTIVKPGDFDIPIEFAFAHESSLMLGAGLVAGMALAAREGVSGPRRAGLALYCLLVFAALLVSQRRAATLVAIVGFITTGAMLVRIRPVAVTAITVPALLLGTLYLGAYWNKEYGAAAQPARAIRSQIDPTPRDESSDLYRDHERASVIETLRENRVFGVGFGRPFGAFQDLPDLTSFWPLQYYTPHQNLLWLWLKLGFVGMSVFLAVIAIAVGRGLQVMRRATRIGEREVLAIVSTSVLLMFTAFATVDIALVGIRGTLVLAVTLALAFRLPQASAAGADGSGVGE